jgi:Protein of unknown function (DUF3303)
VPPLTGPWAIPWKNNDLEDSSDEIHGDVERAARMCQRGCRPIHGWQRSSAGGAKLLGRWHNADGSGGFSLVETDNPSALYENSAVWTDVLEIHSHSVVDDAEVAPLLAKVFGK